MQPLEAILLDVDGTLLDSVDAHADAWAAALAEEGIAASPDRIRPLVGMGSDKLLPVVSGSESDDERGRRTSERRCEIFRSRFLAQLGPFPKVRDLLCALRELGLRLVVASSASKDDLTALVARAEVKDLLDACVSKDAAQRSKPDPDIILAALDAAQVGPEAAMLIGDTPYDVEAARRAGVPCIALRCGSWNDEGLAGAVAIHGDPADLLAHLRTSPIGIRLGLAARAS